MKPIRDFIVILAWSLVALAQARGAVLTLSPASATVNVGADLIVELQVSDVGAGDALGVYDIDLAFDPSVLSFSGALFGNGLDVRALGSLSFATLGAGAVNLFELSLDSGADLVALQPASFVLVQLSFVATAPGTSTLRLTVNALGNAYGEPLTANLQDAAIVITPVPEPATLLLLAAGLGAVGVRRQISSREREHSRR